MGHDEKTIPRLEERLTVSKQTVVDGRVQISTQTHLSEEIVSTDLERRSVDVSRKSLDIEITSAPPIRTEGDVTIISVVEERLVKRLFLVEEVHIRQQIRSETEMVPAVLRKQTVTIERTHETKEN